MITSEKEKKHEELIRVEKRIQNTRLPNIIQSPNEFLKERVRKESMDEKEMKAETSL